MLSVFALSDFANFAADYLNFKISRFLVLKIRQTTNIFRQLKVFYNLSSGVRSRGFLYFQSFGMSNMASRSSAMKPYRRLKLDFSDNGINNYCRANHLAKRKSR